MAGVREQGEDHWQKAEHLLWVTAVCWNSRDFRFQGWQQERPACMWVTNPGAGFTQGSASQTPLQVQAKLLPQQVLHPSFTKLCLLSFSRAILSTRNGEANIYMLKNRWKYPYLNVSLPGFPLLLRLWLFLHHFWSLLSLFYLPKAPSASLNSFGPGFILLATKKYDLMH